MTARGARKTARMVAPLRGGRNGRAGRRQRVRRPPRDPPRGTTRAPPAPYSAIVGEGCRRLVARASAVRAGASWSTCWAPWRSGSGEATAERTSAALQVLKQQGRATGGVAPYGFQFIAGRRAVAPGRAGNARGHHRASPPPASHGRRWPTSSAPPGTAPAPAASGHGRVPTRSTKRANVTTKRQRRAPGAQARRRLYVTPDVARQLRVIAAQEDTSVQALIIEGIGLVVQARDRGSPRRTTPP